MDSFAKRRDIVVLIFIVVAVIFMAKLFALQIVSTKYKRSATQNVLREEVEYPVRGLIYDRNGELLVFNQAAYDLLVTPRELKAFDTLALCKIVEVSIEDFRSSLRKAKNYSSYKPSVVVKQISPSRFALMQEQMYKFPGFYFQTRTLRSYNHNFAAHVLGYIGEANQVTISENPYYRPGDYFGVTGVESAYENYLRGRKGTKFYMVDVHNRQKGSYEEGRLDTAAFKGKDLISTLDYKLQEYGELLMQNKAGSIVVIEPATGEILALVSSPSYTPDKLIGRARIENFPKLLNDPLLPLYNRAIKAQYPPGSTFKMLQALVALQEGVITPNTYFPCNNGFHVGNFHQACHHHQSFEVVGSIAQSCNAFYSYTFKSFLESSKMGGVRTAYEKWREHVLSFGFGDRVSYDFPQELKGFIPPADYYQERVFKASRWRALPIISLSIGQGEIQTTPMQMANYAAILANRGYYYKPHVVKKIQDTELDPVLKEKHFTTVDPQHFELAVRGMEMVMSLDGGGTGRGSAIPGIVVCGKTGPAENPHGADHSTFIAFAPKDEPKIAIAVYVENGKWGATYAAPIASLMIEKYLNDSIQPSRKNIETNMINTNLLYPDLPNFIKYPK